MKKIYSTLIICCFFGKLIAQPLTGIDTLCYGGTTTFIDIVTGGTWSSSNTSIATVNTFTGVVTGINIGTAIISYTVSTYSDVKPITIINTVSNILPSGAVVCLGTPTTLTDATSGGLWTSSNTLKATVSGGIVTGVAIGTATISYTLLSGCTATELITINTFPAPIVPISATICESTSYTLNDITTGGTWSS